MTTETRLNSASATIAGDAFDAAWLRALMVLPASVAMTMLLVSGMERLIRADPNRTMPEDTPFVVPNPILAPREPDPVERFKPEPPQPPEMAPEIPEMPPMVDGVDVVNIVERPPVHNPPGGGLMKGFSANTPIPTVMVQPNYPRRAANRGIEGFVDVQFDVTAMGTAENIRVVASQPESVFDSAALKAIARWKFNPVMMEGKAVAYKGMVQRLVFEMAKGQG